MAKFLAGVLAFTVLMICSPGPASAEVERTFKVIKFDPAEFINAFRERYGHRHWGADHRHVRHRIRQQQQSESPTSGSPTNTNTVATANAGQNGPASEACFRNADGDQICPHKNTNMPTTAPPTPAEKPGHADQGDTPTTVLPPADETEGEPEEAPKVFPNPSREPESESAEATEPPPYEWPAGFECAGEGGLAGPPPVGQDPSEYTMAFQDDFDGNVLDTSKWYTKRPWGWSTLGSDNYSVGKGLLTLTGDGLGPNYSITSVGPGMQGFALGGGGYFEARIRFDATPTGNGGWPSFWTMSAEHLWGNETTHWFESDFMEDDFWTAGGSPSEYGATIHDWLGNDGNTQDVHGVGGVNSEWHVYGSLWHPAKAGEKGYWAFFFDGKEVGRTTYSQGGTYSIGDSQHMPVILGTAKGWPMEVDWVRVWKFCDSQ